MALRTILEYPDPRLRTKAQPVTEFGADLARRIDGVRALGVFAKYRPICGFSYFPGGLLRSQIASFNERKILLELFLYIDAVV